MARIQLLLASFAVINLLRNFHAKESANAGQNDKNPLRYMHKGFSINSLTMSYFHTGTRTIIGAKAFHCPVRDGKEWDRLAMVIRHNLLSSCILGQPRPIHRVSNQIF